MTRSQTYPVYLTEGPALWEPQPNEDMESLAFLAKMGLGSESPGDTIMSHNKKWFQPCLANYFQTHFAPHVRPNLDDVVNTMLENGLLSAVEVTK